MSTTTTPPTPLKIDLTTLLSLLTTLLILLAAYTASTLLLPARAPLRTRILFVWHAFDALIHLLLEGSFLYTCFFVSSSSSSSAAYSWHFTPRDTFFLADPTRTYGAAQGDGFAARLWQEYARADRRWGGADLTVVSLEILTVGFGTGIAAAVCAALVGGGREEGRGGVSAKAWFWMVVLATGELYGGFMTFAPEWLSGSPNLDTSNWLYLWVYLAFFNGLWVVFPGWILYEAYGAITGSGGVTEKRSGELKRE